MARAVNRRLRRAAVRVRTRVTTCEICGGQSGTWEDHLDDGRMTETCCGYDIERGEEELLR
jgi:hypothetical protein